MGERMLRLLNKRVNSPHNNLRVCPNRFHNFNIEFIKYNKLVGHVQHLLGNSGLK